jgi:hypothetical protein
VGYSVVIKNDYDKPLMVEIRTGNNASDYTKNNLFFKDMLEAGDSRDPDNDDPIVCYRRSANPDDLGGPMGDWNTYSPNDQNTPALIKLSEAD